MLARDNGLSDLVEAHLVAAGLRDPAVVLRTMQTEAAARLAAAGLGLAVVPANVVPPDLPALICEPDPPLTRRLAAFSRGRLSPAADRFVHTMLSRDRTLEREASADPLPRS
jgi:DNA-binding transcriptional LysR family regulator